MVESAAGLPAQDKLSLREARRIALAAQGFGRPRRSGLKTRKHIDEVLGQIGLLQIDSVNVLARAHYLPLFSRLGPYNPALLDRAAWDRRRRSLFEYWGHEASLLPLALQPLLRWRMARAERGEGIYRSLAQLARERPEFIETVYREIEERGPCGAGELEAAARGTTGWWGWSDAKVAVEYLFWAGRVTTATRRGFERLYDLPERVFAPDILGQPTPSEPEAHRALLRIAGRALGVATESDLRDYFRLDAQDSKARIPELVEEGALLPVKVEGWTQPAYLDPQAAAARRIRAQSLLSPFDPLVWERDRTERLFDFRYRLEIYTPAAKRQHGYYVLPFLLGESLVGRVDLKADRQNRTLLVAAAHHEPSAKPDEVAAALSEELSVMAGWLGLDRILVAPRGDLAGPLARHHPSPIDPGPSDSGPSDPGP